MAKGRKTRLQGDEEETEVVDSPSGSGTRVQVRKVRRDGWTIAKKSKFLGALAVTANVRKAAKHAGMSKTAAYDLRQRDPAFADQWADALRSGVELLELHLLKRARKGDKKAIIFQGKVTEHYKVYPDDLAKFLVSRHGPSSDPAAGGQATGSLHRRLQAQHERQEQVRQKLIAEICRTDAEAGPAAGYPGEVEGGAGEHEGGGDT